LSAVFPEKWGGLSPWIYNWGGSIPPIPPGSDAYDVIPLKIAPSHGGSEHGSLGPTESTSRTA